MNLHLNLQKVVIIINLGINGDGKRENIQNLSRHMLGCSIIWIKAGAVEMDFLSSIDF